MIRKTILHIEFAALVAVQAVGLVSAITASLPAAAQTGTVADQPEPARNDPDMVQDFSVALPPSAAISRTYTDYVAYTGQYVTRLRPEQDFYATSGIAATAHRFYDDKKHGGRKGPAILLEAIAGFARECAAKGGVIEPPGSAIYALNATRLPRPPLESRMDICMRAPEVPLGILVTMTNKALRHHSYAIFVLAPSHVETPGRVAARQAARDAYRDEQARQLEAKHQAARAALPGWRRSIAVGTETSCGPVLRVNGELIEVAYFRTREPKWYRRTELWPSGYDVDGWETCR